MLIAFFTIPPLRASETRFPSNRRKPPQLLVSSGAPPFLHRLISTRGVRTFRKIGLARPSDDGALAPVWRQDLSLSYCSTWSFFEILFKIRLMLCIFENDGKE